MSTTEEFTDAERAKIGTLISLGDNCEFGFVQRKLGVETSSLIRWAIAKPEDVARLLEKIADGDPLTDLYGYEKLVPHSPKMVRDAFTNFCFHTQMAINAGDTRGTYVFDEDGFARLKCWQKEKSKFDYLATAFRAKLTDSANIYIVKHLEGADGAVANIGAQLHKLNAGNQLLVVAQDPERAGQASWGAGNIIHGYVTKFAPYSAADTGDFDSWHSILRFILSSSRT